MTSRSGTRVTDEQARAQGWERAALRIRHVDLAALDEVASRMGLSRSAAAGTLAHEWLANQGLRGNRQGKRK